MVRRSARAKARRSFMESRVRKTQGLSARTSAVGFHLAIVGSSVVKRSPYQNGLLRVIPGEPLRLKFGSSRIGSRSGGGGGVQ